MAGMVKEAEHAAQTLAMQLQFVPVTSPGEIMDAFSTITREPTDALCMFPSPMLFTEWGRIASMAADKKLPTIYVAREGVELGGLMSYGANLPDLSRQTALYVDKILEGAKPAELPVQQPTKFELVINLTAAKALGLTITPNFLLIADEVIPFLRARAPMSFAPISTRKAPAKPRRRLIGKAASIGHKVDVTKRIEVKEMAERAIATFGHIEFLFNSAGAAIRRAKFLEIDDTLMEKTFALNVNGTLHSMQTLLPHMLANRHGVIVNMASMAHRRGGPGSSIHYAAAKGAVVSMTLGVAREFATQGIRALSISPGPIKRLSRAGHSPRPS